MLANANKQGNKYKYYPDCKERWHNHYVYNPMKFTGKPSKRCYRVAKYKNNLWQLYFCILAVNNHN